MILKIKHIFDDNQKYKFCKLHQLKYALKTVISFFFYIDYE